MAAVSSGGDASEDEFSVVVISAILLRRRRPKHPKWFWIHPIFKRRREQGEYHNLLQEMRLSDEESHFRYLRMSKECFDLLLSKVQASLTRHHYSNII